MTAVVRATILIAVFSILSKILGLVRQMVFANRLGAGMEVDIYVASFRLPDLVFNLLVLGTLSVAFIPVFVNFLEKDRAEALVIASTVFNLTLVVMGFFALAGILLAPWLVNWLVPGFEQAAKQQTVQLTRILMLSPLLFSLSSVLTSILHSLKRFFLAAVAPLFYNLAIIGGIIFLYPLYGLRGIAWAVVFGAFLHFLLQLPAVWQRGLRPFQYLALAHPGVKKIGKLFLPRVFGLELGQISLLVASVLGSSLPAGSLAIFYYAYDLETVPLGVFAVSFAVAAFPTMTSYFAKNNVQGFKDFFSQTIVYVLFLMIPISVLMLLLRAQITRLILGAGEHTHFDFTATRLTAQALGFFVLSLFAQSLVPLLARAFYALQNTVLPVMAGIIAAVINIILAVFLTKFAGPGIMALAFSIAITVQMMILFWALHKRLGDLNDEFLIVRLIKISIASIAMAVAAFITLYLVAPLVNMQTYAGIMSQTVASLLVALPAYLLAGIAVKLPESRSLSLILKAWFKKFTRPLTSAIVSMFTDLG